MKTTQFILISGMAFAVSVLAISCKEATEESAAVSMTIAKEDLENQVWNMEETYWQYVQKGDTTSYKKLWHENFIGYPSFGDGVSGKSGIAVWIPELHKDKDLTFSYMLHKKNVNAIEDVVIAFYDADEIWTNTQNEVVRKERTKFTHTWKKFGGSWLILGGMAALKK